MSKLPNALSFAYKRTRDVKYATALCRAWAGTAFAGKQTTHLYQVLRRRNAVVAASNGEKRPDSIEIFASYYRALCIVERCFNISSDGGEVVKFKWSHFLHGMKTCKNGDIQFEKACVLFNLAAHLSQCALTQKTEIGDDHRLAVQYFKEAAAVFALTRDVASKVAAPKPSDLRPDFLTMAEKLMLAQAQECVFWKAMKDAMSAYHKCRIAKQVALFYSDALKSLHNSTARECLERTWKDVIQSKGILFEAFSQYYAAKDARDNMEYGVEISRWNQTIWLIQTLKKSRKLKASSLTSAADLIATDAANSLKKTQEENVTIYMQVVPPFDQLPVIVGTQIVTPEECLYLDPARDKIFPDFIPNSHV